ncbi:BgTH12-01003 [Blumeria graminis f. sp. triticale]|uniref:BgTH12-01003 n=1 Tax=Blumeria graminis f. sp. triticale TaxID=1689686 RepID=A0A9W4D7C5_BLUGR|nr:BgTH12-01003 [Blumeria graminis f. sp. triticale]
MKKDYEPSASDNTKIDDVASKTPSLTNISNVDLLAIEICNLAGQNNDQTPKASSPVIQEATKGRPRINDGKKIYASSKKKYRIISTQKDSPQQIKNSKLGLGPLKFLKTSHVELLARSFTTQSKTMDDFQEELCSTFRSMMGRLRAYRGNLTVMINFGRIMISKLHDNFIAKRNINEKIFHVDEARKVLRDLEFNSNSRFTNILTSSTSDIKNIISMKHDDGQEYWDTKKIDSSLVYQLHFLDSSDSLNENFFVEIDAETFTIQVKSISDLGTIYVHGVKRFWDFCISALGDKKDSSLEILHRELVEMISDSLFIPPDITCEIKGSLKFRYSLEEVNVRHVVRYPSKDNNSILQIVEVRCLDVSLRDSPQTESVIYHAVSSNTKRENNDQSLGLWFEVSIGCRELNDYLSQNQKLELGDLVNWTPESLDLLSLDQYMFIPACKILEKLDGVGSLNDNNYNNKRLNLTRQDNLLLAEPASYW